MVLEVEFIEQESTLVLPEEKVQDLKSPGTRSEVDRLWSFRILVPLQE